MLNVMTDRGHPPALFVAHVRTTNRNGLLRCLRTCVPHPSLSYAGRDERRGVATTVLRRLPARYRPCSRPRRSRV
jgi:hypothetical protein